MRHLLRRLRRDRHGVTIIEFAIVAPVMIAMIMFLGDLLYRTYAQAILDGAIQKAGRDSAIQGGGDNTAALDAKVISMLQNIAKSASWSSKRENYNSFAVIKPETFIDKNSNGLRDPGECFDDVNNNGTWDQNPARTGQGGADDVTKYTFTITYPRLFPVTGFFGVPDTQTISSSTLLKNQPYARQVHTVPQVCT